MKNQTDDCKPSKGPMLLGHEATPDWIEAVNAHHTATEELLNAANARIKELESALREAREIIDFGSTESDEFGPRIDAVLGN